MKLTEIYIGGLENITNIVRNNNKSLTTLEITNSPLLFIDDAKSEEFIKSISQGSSIINLKLNNCGFNDLCLKKLIEWRSFHIDQVEKQRKKVAIA